MNRLADSAEARSGFWTWVNNESVSGKALSPWGGGYGVDGEDYLEVALGAAEVGEGVGETGDDGSAAGGV